MKYTNEKILVDLSNYNSDGKIYMRQISEYVFTKQVSNRWEEMFIKTEFYLINSNKWIASWHKIGTRMIK